MITNARRAALDALYKVEQRSIYAKNALGQVFATTNFSRRDRAFITELVYGVIRWRLTLDFVIRDFSLAAEASRLSSWVRNIIRLGVYQLMFMDKVPPYAAVNESVELTKEFEHMGIVMFVNGLLRGIAENLDNINYPDEKNIIRWICIKHSYPEWLVRRWTTQFGVQEAIDLCKANNQEPQLCGRTNLLKISRNQLIKELAKEGVETVPGKFSPEAIRLKNCSPVEELNAYKNGWLSVQSDSAQLISHLLGPQPGETILDACAAPGGKASHIAQLMKNKGKIYAFDLLEFKLARIKQNARRLGVKIIEPVLQDATRLPAEFINRMDRVLVDPPCSGLGIISGHPDIKWNRTEREVSFELPKLQLALLESAAGGVKSGGILVYSVCSFEPEETARVIKKFLKSRPVFNSEPVSPQLPADLANLQDPDGFLYIYPHRHNSAGFFAARLKKM